MPCNYKIIISCCCTPDMIWGMAAAFCYEKKEVHSLSDWNFLYLYLTFL